MWSIKFVSPLTTRISVISSSPARRPWYSNSPLVARDVVTPLQNNFNQAHVKGFAHDQTVATIADQFYGKRKKPAKNTYHYAISKFAF